VKTKLVEYTHADAVFEGFMAWDEAKKGRRPGVLVVHQFMGLGEHERERAQQLAALGYVALAADVYGKGVRPAKREEAMAMTAALRGDRPTLRARVRAGLDALRASDLVDARRIGAIGFCFGGTAALELARSGAELSGVVSFHGGLSSPAPEDGRNIKAKVLVLHGADDPTNSPENIAAFQQEMRAGGVDWQMVSYGGAVHAFTQKAAGNDPSKGVAYNERADRRSWQAMLDFFAEIFAAP
jgi:dienelactone hydrolase